MNTSHALKQWVHSDAAFLALSAAWAFVFPALSGDVPAASTNSSFSILHSSFAVGRGPAAPYGVCAHLPRHDAEFRNEECANIAALGASTVRFGVSWRSMQKSPEMPLDFSRLDAIVAEAESHGLTILPILYWPPKWAQPVYEHLDEYAAFIGAVVEHYGEHFPAIELWNEENLKHFWGEEPDPAKFALVLKAGYEAAKLPNSGLRNDPRIPQSTATPETRIPAPGLPLVYFGGTAGVPLDYIRKVYEAGGGPFFDAMNVHPYSHPYAPEGDLDKKLENLRALMAEFGDAEKPIVITEHGWPTHDATVKSASILLAGLKVARPEQKSWRAVYATTHAGDAAIAAAIEAILPPGSSCEVCFGDRLRERLAADDVDAVIYPFDSSFPEDTFAEVREFVRNGGVLVDTGGAPMWWRCREVEPGRFERLEQDNGENPLRARLRVDVDAWWLNPALPQEGRAFPTDTALAAGYKGDPAGERVWRFFTPRLLQPGDELIPLLTLENDGTTTNRVDANNSSLVTRHSSLDGGNAAVAACVLRFYSDFKGAIVLSGDKTRGQAASNDETNQARYLTRAMAIAFAEGVERYFWYEFRAPETDPTYSEDHFGLTHSDMAPKPAFDAYRNFVAKRPAGSIQRRVPLRNPATGVWRSEWTRPDGTVAGVFWKPGEIEEPVFFEGEAQIP